MTSENVREWSQSLRLVRVALVLSAAGWCVAVLALGSVVAGLVSWENLLRRADSAGFLAALIWVAVIAFVWGVAMVCVVLRQPARPSAGRGEKLVLATGVFSGLAMPCVAVAAFAIVVRGVRMNDGFWMAIFVLATLGTWLGRVLFYRMVLDHQPGLAATFGHRWLAWHGRLAWPCALWVVLCWVYQSVEHVDLRGAQWVVHGPLLIASSGALAYAVVLGYTAHRMLTSLTSDALEL